MLPRPLSWTYGGGSWRGKEEREEEGRGAKEHPSYANRFPLLRPAALLPLVLLQLLNETAHKPAEYASWVSAPVLLYSRHSNSYGSYMGNDNVMQL